MSGIRYIDIDNLPQGMSEENRQFVMELAKTSPKPTFLRMIHPFWFYVTDEVITRLKQTQIPEKLCKEIALLKRPHPFETKEAFLLAIEERIGQDARAQYDDILLESAVHPLAGSLVPSEIPPLTTHALELIIGAVHKVLSQILTRNSNACQCWREYGLLEEQKMDLIEIFGTGGTSFRAGKMLVEQASRLLTAAARMPDSQASATLVQEASKLVEQGTVLAAQGKEEATASGNLSKTAFEKKLSDIDRVIQQRWKGDIPYRFAESLSEGACPHCRKYRELDDTLTLATPDFLHNLFNIALGGEMPLISILPFVESVFSQIYNPDMIPEKKKKDMVEFTEKIRLQAALDKLLSKILTVFGLPPISMTPHSSGESTPNTRPDSTDITPATGDSPQMMLTEDFRPVSGTGSTTNTEKESDSDMTS